MFTGKTSRKKRKGLRDCMLNTHAYRSQWVGEGVAPGTRQVEVIEEEVGGRHDNDGSHQDSRSPQPSGIWHPGEEQGTLSSKEAVEGNSTWGW